jgi:hypothetical protein
LTTRCVPAYAASRVQPWSRNDRHSRDRPAWAGTVCNWSAATMLRKRVRLDDPPAVARDWVRDGFSRLHVVDLDAAHRPGCQSRGDP